MITLALMKSLWPNGNSRVPGTIEGIVATAPSVFQKYGIDSDLLVAHVMAQISHECGAGWDMVENLNYSEERMMQVWPSRFPDYASTAGYAHNPKNLANKVYNGRMGNVSGSDDGWNYRGRGATQTTGKEGYKLLSVKTGIDVLNNPDVLLDPKYFLELGVADFVICGCLPFAKADDVLGVTKKLNGGTVGLTERKIWLSRWKTALAKTQSTAPSPTPVQVPPERYPTPAPAPIPAPPPVVVQPKISQSIWVTIFNALVALFTKGQKK